MAKNLAKAESTELFTETAGDHIKDTGRGNDTVGADDLTIPRLGLIQDLSPQRKKNQPEYIEGAEEGMLFNTLTMQLYGSECMFVPVYFRKEWVIWVDRQKGGGLRGSAPTLKEAEGIRSELEDADDCESIETAQQYGMVIASDGSVEPIVLGMSKSQLSPSKKLNSMIGMHGGDRWARGFKVKAVMKNGPKGDYYNYEFHPLGFVPPSIYEAAEQFYEQIAAGDIKIAETSPENDDEM